MPQKSKTSHTAPFAWIELGLLLALAPLLLLPGRLLPIGWHPLLVGLIVLLRVAHVVVLPAPWPSTPLDLSALVVFFSLPIAIFISVDKPLSWSVAGYVVLGIALFFALANWPSTPRTPVMLFCLMMAMGGRCCWLGSVSLPDHQTRIRPAYHPFWLRCLSERGISPMSTSSPVWSPFSGPLLWRPF